MLAASVIALFATPLSGAAGVAAPSADSRAQGTDETRVSAPVQCPAVERAVKFYSARVAYWRAKRGAPNPLVHGRSRCPRYLTHVLQRKAYALRREYERWFAYHHDWRSWLPDKWQRIGACETGYGRRPGNWRHSNGSYEGAFGFAKSSWDAFKGRADRKAGPYPEDAWQATPRQQYEVALAIWRAYGFSGWGCRNA